MNPTRLTIPDRVEALVRAGTCTTPEIVAAMPGVASTSVYSALTKLVQLGRLVRTEPSQYAPSDGSQAGVMTADDGDSEEKHAPDADATASTVRWCLWDDGDLVFFRDDEQALVLTQEEAARLSVWLQQRVA